MRFPGACNASATSTHVDVWYPIADEVKSSGVTQYRSRRRPPLL